MPEDAPKRRLDYWKMVWACPERVRARIWSPYRAVPAVLAAAVQAVWSARTHPALNPYPEMWTVIIIVVGVYLVLYSVETLWSFGALSPADIHWKQDGEINILKAKAQELEKRAEIEALSRSVRLSASLKTEDRCAVLFMRMSSQVSRYQSIHVQVSEMTLVVYNLGEKPVRLRGYKLWKLHAVESSLEFPLHDLLTPDVPTTIDVTKPLLHVISGQAQHDYESIRGEYTIRFEVTCCQDSDQPHTQSFDFHVTCQRGAGGATLRLDAKETTR